MGLLQRIFGRQAPSPAAPKVEYQAPPPPFQVSSQLSWFGYSLPPGGPTEVVGEGYRQAAFDRVVGPKTDDGATTKRVIAQMAADRGNPHDPDAVAVYLGGHLVGYIPRERTAMWHPVIEELKARDWPATCVAEVTGGWYRPHGQPAEGHYGLFLLTDEPPQIMRADHGVLSIGTATVAMQGEERCQDLLSQVQHQGGRWVVDLSREERVVVRYRGTEIGRLTPKMTERYGPVVDLLRSEGWPTTCWARVATGKTKLEAELFLPSRMELAAIAPFGEP